jgi:radical SAM protein with 4Fe4S-binding SPASM domain
MSCEEFGLILDKLSGCTKYIYYHLMGEPLTHPELCNFVKMATERGFKSVITTNGSLIPRRKAELLELELFKINLSIHSFEKDSHEDHESYLLSLIDYAKSAAQKGTIVVFRLWNNGFDGDKNEFALKLLREKLPGEWADHCLGIKIREKIYVEFGERFEWPDSSADIKGDKFYCYALKDHFGILCDGTVVPCCLDSDGVIDLGNVFKDDLKEILNSKRAVDICNGFKNKKASEELCKRCGYAQRFIN